MTSINEETTDEQTNPFKSTNEDHTKNDNFKSNNPFDEEPNPAEEQQHESEPRNNQYNVQRTPKPPKRRTSKSIKYMLKRAPSTSLLRNRSYSQSTEKEDKEIEEDTSKSNLSSTKYKGSTSNPIDLISANKTSPSPAKRPVFQRSKTLSTIKRLPLEKKGKKSKRTAISPTTPCADSPTELTQATVQNNNLDYSDVIALMRKSPLHKPVGNLPIPKMSIEYGKADIDTREYVHDMIIHEIENGFFLGPVLSCR